MALGQIEKQFGKGSIMRMGDRTNMGMECIPTGALSLDVALGIAGLPRGRVVEIFGPEASGKSTLAMHVVAEAQRNGGICAYIDAEHAMDPTYARAIGVNVDDLLISQPDTGEQALEITDMLIRSGALDVVVIGSVAALTPKAEIEGEMGDTDVGHQVRTPGGWREAQELAVGDRVLQSVPHHLSEFQWEVLLGGLMGDSALSPTRSRYSARLRWGHGVKQAGYSDWKASLFSNVGVS